MSFKITGRVREKESGLGIRGLLIRAYDKDLLFDDLLGTATTDDDGFFELVYAQEDFQELFDCHPDIYLAVYAPPFRKILDTKDHVRWAGNEHEQFDLVIEHSQLGNLAPNPAPDEVSAGVRISLADIVIEKRGQYDVPILPKFGQGAVVGAPSLLEQVQYIVLPLGGTVLDLEIFSGEPVRLAGPVNPMPVQAPIFDVGIDKVPAFEPKPTPPDARFFDSRTTFPEQLVEVERIDQFGPFEIVVVRVRPMQYDANDRTFVLYQDLRYRVRFDLDNVRRVREAAGRDALRFGVMQAEQLDLILSLENVFFDWQLFPPGTFFIQEKFPYVIITDNFSWKESIPLADGETRPPDLSERGAALAGNLVAEFEKLAHWKTSCGLRTRVVTVSEIVDGTFGDFKKDARDLQETIRNFLKHAYENWGTLDVLLGGDVDVVPIRSLLVPALDCKRDAAVKNPPASRQCFVDTQRSIAKLCIEAEPLSFDLKSSFILCAINSGTPIPFSETGSDDSLRWYFTKESDFKSPDKDQVFTPLPAVEAPADPKDKRVAFVIVEGPIETIDDDYYWAYEPYFVPSDLYYSSLKGKLYSQAGHHDFDLNGNGLYGQHKYDAGLKKEISLDGVSIFPDVQVGRVPAETGDEARAFVDKLIAYETLKDPSGSPFALDPAAYLTKIIYATTVWYEFQNLPQVDATQPLAPGEYVVFDKNATVMLTYRDVDAANYRLFAVNGDTKKEIPHNIQADTNTLGWFLAESSTRYVIVVGPEGEAAPDKFIWGDRLNYESAVQSEMLRAQMKEWFPSFNKEKRFYEDFYDDPASIKPIDAVNLHSELNKGCHFLSLIGHGAPEGCCWLSAPAAFTNKDAYFIAFANSCSTARPDGVDSLGETSVVNADGGAVAYIGNTRMSLTGSSYYFEEFFWQALSSWGDLGLAAGLRLATAGVNWIGGSYETMLYGDPTMQVWTEIPQSYEVTHPGSVAWGSEFDVNFYKKGSDFGDHWAPGRVTILGGWEDSSKEPAVFMSVQPLGASVLVNGKIVQTGDTAHFELPSSGTPPATLRVVVSGRNYRPYIGTIKVTKSESEDSEEKP